MSNTLKRTGPDMRIPKDTTCANCGEPITFYSPVPQGGYWLHPDRVDVDESGTMCADGEESAEP